MNGTCLSHPERPEFGCLGCIEALRKAQVAAEIANAPTRVVTFTWSATISLDDTFEAHIPIPAGWDADRVQRHCHDYFDAEIANEVCNAMDDAQMDLIATAEPDDIKIGKVIDSQPDNQPPLFGAAS